jgi:hypothetical protein
MKAERATLAKLAHFGGAHVGSNASRQARPPTIRYGSIATEIGWLRDVRFPSERDRIADIPDRQLRATSLDFHGTKFASQKARSNAHFSSLLAPKLLCESVR